MQIAFFVANVPDNCGAFFSDITLAKALKARGHQVVLINCGGPKNNFAGGVQEDIIWKPQLVAGHELDQSQIWMSPHFPQAPLVRRLNTNYRRPIIFTLHFAGASNMFQFSAPITWKETFWQVNSYIPNQLVPRGFPAQVVSHTLRHPFVDATSVWNEDPSERKYVTLVNANLNKGLAIFLEIANRMPDTQFLAVRSQQHQPNQILNIPVPDNITWINFSRDMKSLQAKSRIVLIPSAQESFCMVALEAMLNGIPVLYSKPSNKRILQDQGSTEGMEEWIQPAGIACDLSDTEDWVNAIRSLEDPNVQEEVSQKVSEHVKPILNELPQAIQDIEKFARENPVSAGTSFKIQNAAPVREQGPVLTAIPQAPVNARVGWQNGRLSFGRR